jgi:hypothetical protein
LTREGPSNWSHAPVAAVSACSPGSGLRSRWARTTLSAPTLAGRGAPRSPTRACRARCARRAAHRYACERQRRPRRPSARAA